MTLNDLANFYGSDKGSSYSFANGYAIHYDEIFAPIKNQKINLLEIGLVLENKTSSIQMWSDYFTNGYICGFDIQDCKNIENERVKFYQGNQYVEKDLLDAVNYFGVEFDVIIDDGIHTSEAQQKSLGVLFPYLKSGGRYIIEDVSLPHIKHEIISCEHSFITLQHLIVHKKLITPFIANVKYIEENLKGGYFITNQQHTCSTFILEKT